MTHFYEETSYVRDAMQESNSARGNVCNCKLVKLVLVRKDKVCSGARTWVCPRVRPGRMWSILFCFALLFFFLFLIILRVGIYAIESMIGNMISGSILFVTHRKTAAVLRLQFSFMQGRLRKKKNTTHRGGNTEPNRQLPTRYKCLGETLMQVHE